MTADLLAEQQTTFTSPQVAAITGATLRELGYWERAGVIRPSVRGNGSGRRHSWTVDDVARVAEVVAWRRSGATLESIAASSDLSRCPVCGAQPERTA